MRGQFDYDTWENVGNAERLFRYSDRHILRISPPKLGVANKLLMKGLEESNVRHYFAKMLSSALLFGATEEDAKRDMQVIWWTVQIGLNCCHAILFF